MLLSIKEDQSVRIGEHVRIMVAAVDADMHVHLLVQAPRQIPVRREEACGFLPGQELAEVSAAPSDPLFSLLRIPPAERSFYESVCASIQDEHGNCLCELYDVGIAQRMVDILNAAGKSME
jgi:sRNA-binding carbon storage regulator CsrA